MANFYNQATLTLGGKVLTSNVTEGELISRIRLTKNAVSTDYGLGDGIVYALTLVNEDTVAKTNITLTDNLGAYTLEGSTQVFVPLTYVEGSILYYQNGIIQPAPAVVAADTLTISGIDIPAGGNVIILYEVRANSFAPLSAGSAIFNTVTTVGDGTCEELEAAAQIPTRDEPILSIAKAICPEEVVCGNPLTYTFIVQNTGNTAVDATDNLILSDTFTPALTNIVVALNGTELAEDTAYTYDEATGAFTTLPGAVPVPAATFTRDAETGVVTTTPGVAIITVTGVI
jgi:uncharacterized repeat protein (TIGR01451 family)